QGQRDHQGGPGWPVAVPVRPGAGRRDLRRVRDLGHRRPRARHPPDRGPGAAGRVQGGLTPMSALVKIRSERDQMSAIERRIADFILENAQLLRDYSSQQLANALGISQSSVVKFCQKLSFKGYPDLKFSISEALARADNGQPATEAPTTPDERKRTLASTLWRRKSEAEGATRLINPPEALEAATEAIGSASRVFIIGLGEDDIHARAFALKLSWVGILT